MNKKDIAAIAFSGVVVAQVADAQTFARVDHVFEVRNPETAITYAYAKPNSISVFDISGDGVPEILTFPSNFTHDAPLDILVYQVSGAGVTYKPSLISGGFEQEFIRDRMIADFNSDGFNDIMLVDQGWELNNRDSNSFLGGEIHLLLGGQQGLEYVPTGTWLRQPQQRRFNHIGSHGDIDGDGDEDAVIAIMGGPSLVGGLRVLINDGTAVFSDYLFDDTITGINGNPSGVAIIKTGEGVKIIAVGYRSFSERFLGSAPALFSFNSGVLSREQTLEKPFPNSSVWRNYGGADAYAVDVNGDGFEDYVQLWETETTNSGIIDEWSNVQGDAAESRYSSIGMNDEMVTVYLQDQEGNLILSSVFPLSQSGSPLLEFVDLNDDGAIDFFTHGFGVNRENIHKTIWLNDGHGQFGNPVPFEVQGFGPRLQVTGFMSDYDLDGDYDYIGLEGIADHANNRSIGERVILFENQGVTFTLDDTSINNQIVSMSGFFGFQVDPHLRSNRSHVADVQRVLNGLGYQAGAVDGLFGPATQAAIIAYNSNNPGRYIPGLTHSNTYAILNQDSAFVAMLRETALSQALGPSPDLATNHGSSAAALSDSTTALSSGAKFMEYIEDKTLGSVDPRDFTAVAEPIVLENSQAKLVAMGNLIISDTELAATYDVIIDWENQQFGATLCQQYYPEFEFLATRLVLGAGLGFGGITDLAQFASNSCGSLFSGGVAVGAWEVESTINFTGINSLLDDLNRPEIGIALIEAMPMLSDSQRDEILGIVTGSSNMANDNGPENTALEMVQERSVSPDAPSTVNFTRASEAVCSNGEQAAFHVYRTGSDQWFVYLQGGGVATNAEEYLSRVPTWTTPRTEPGYLQDTPAIEDFLNKGYNVAVIPYCSNDLYQGSHTHTIRGETVYFRGRAIVEDVIDQLAPDLSAASRVVFGGSSAGAIGLGYNADLIAQFENPYLLVDSFWLDTESRAIRDSWSGPNWDAMEQFVYANMPEHCGPQWASCFPQRTHFDRYGFENVFFIWNMGDPYMRGDTNANRASIESDLAYYGQGLSIQNGEELHPDYADWVHGMLFNDFYDFPLDGGSLQERIWAWLN